MYITKQQFNAIEYALQLAEYFCDEHESGSDQEQNQRDWETFNDAMKAMKEILETQEKSC
jgi:hypothetical protein